MAVMRALVLLFLVFSFESAAAHHCHHGWQHFGRHCYKFFSESVNWVRAEKNCHSIGGNLASVHNTAQNNFLLSIVPANRRTWIGGHDGEIDGQWLWTDGSRFVFTHWCSKEPNNAGRPENCLEINHTNNHCWNDESCTYTMGYICAKPL
ncbi:galactose-specific lectin nattectin-like [Paramisgurnus dabryanus]|uniref:galactose-specific lectin nattectin-like n=1 Tax=Paramisgurnus dabryanus TaxID=90735 RepID=UPI0031F45412